MLEKGREAQVWQSPVVFISKIVIIKSLSQMLEMAVRQKEFSIIQDGRSWNSKRFLRNIEVLPSPSPFIFQDAITNASERDPLNTLRSWRGRVDENERKLHKCQKDQKEPALVVSRRNGFLAILYFLAVMIRLPVETANFKMVFEFARK